MSSPIICFGQQPCGFFPRRFLYAKIATARRVQQELGGRIVYFCHDSDHDARETQTLLRYRKTGRPLEMNFTFENKIQRKYSPLYLKRIAGGWHANALRQLPAFVNEKCVGAFRQTTAANAADFCLEMYRCLGLLEGIEVVRSSAPEVRRAACEVEDFFVDVPYEGEMVRARHVGGALQLHKGGGVMIELPRAAFEKAQISPARDSRLRWMQSVVHCTHYIAGPGEQAYLHKEETPEVTFINRDEIDRPNEAYTEIT
jgi:hypothetical protein